MRFLARHRLLFFAIIDYSLMDLRHQRTIMYVKTLIPVDMVPTKGNTFLSIKYMAMVLKKAFFLITRVTALIPS